MAGPLSAESCFVTPRPQTASAASEANSDCEMVTQRLSQQSREMSYLRRQLEDKQDENDKLRQQTHFAMEASKDCNAQLRCLENLLSSTAANLKNAKGKVQVLTEENTQMGLKLKRYQKGTVQRRLLRSEKKIAKLREQVAHAEETAQNLQTQSNDYRKKNFALFS